MLSHRSLFVLGLLRHPCGGAHVLPILGILGSRRVLRVHVGRRSPRRIHDVRIGGVVGVVRIILEHGMLDTIV